jgi:hypothetical protein
MTVSPAGPTVCLVTSTSELSYHQALLVLRSSGHARPMSNRGYLLLLLLLMLDGNTNIASAQTPVVQVQVYDDAGLAPAALHEFIASTQKILIGSGVSVVVDACARGAAALCVQRTGISKRIVMRVVAKPYKSMENVHGEMLGFAVADLHGGTCATVFRKSAEDMAGELNHPWTMVLAYAAAHEVGHLLLGYQAHSPRGLMKATWDVRDVWAMAQGQLHFSLEQTRELRTLYGAARQVEAGATATLPVRQ